MRTHGPFRPGIGGKINWSTQLTLTSLQVHTEGLESIHTDPLHSVRQTAFSPSFSDSLLTAWKLISPEIESYEIK